MKKILLVSSLMVMIALVGCTSDHGHDHDDDHVHDHSVEIEGKDLRTLTVQEVADLWEIHDQTLLDKIIEEFGFKGEYTTKTTLEDMRLEYQFSPAIIKDIAEDIKQQSIIKQQGVTYE